MSLPKELIKIQMPGTKLRILTSALILFLWGRGQKAYVYVLHTNEIVCDIPVYNLSFSS